MKGQILVVRGGTAESPPDELETYLRNQDVELGDAETVWLGRLAGSIVGFATTVGGEQGLILNTIHVGDGLRRKNIGRYLVREIRRLAGGSDEPAKLTISSQCGSHPFFDSIRSELE